MGVTYDDNGKVLKVKSQDPNRLPKASEVQNVIES